MMVTFDDVNDLSVRLARVVASWTCHDAVMAVLDDDAVEVCDAETADVVVAPRRRRRVLRRVLVGLAALVTVAGLAVGGILVALTVEGRGTPSAAARGTGHDALWLGHAWVDGRRRQPEVDALAARVRVSGIRDLFVHAGPLRDDGTLDRGLVPQARWLTGAVHAALPGVRVQAWLGAHPLPDELHLDSPSTRAAILASVDQVLDDGFDGVHFDFEPVTDGNRDLLTMLHEAHLRTGSRGAVLSVSAIHTQPWPGVAAATKMLPGPLTVWSDGYLRRVAGEVDQVALMAYDTALPSAGAYAGYVRQVTTRALAAVPARVGLLIGVPAYHDQRWYHHARAETVTAAVRGIRLALGAHPRQREFGVAMYVDFTATAADWAAYDRDWAAAGGRG